MSEKIKIIFLGTSDAVPSSGRNHTSIWLSYRDENILIDAGEGTQRQIRKAGLNPCRITRILITHWHGDHVLGIPGLLQTLAFSGYNKTLYIYGPKGTKKYMKKIFDAFVFANMNKISFKIKEINGKKRFLENNDFYIEAFPLYHGTFCNGYKFVKKGQIKIDKARLKKSNLPQNQILQKLKQGKDIKYKGKTYRAKDLTFKEGEKKISFVFDTKFDNKIISNVKNSDLLISEASFSSDMAERAKEYRHLTAKQAAEIAKKADVKKLVLTHISQRYQKNLNVILNQAKKTFKNSYLAKDLMKIEI